VEIERETIRALAWFERANVGATEHLGSSEGREFESLTRRHQLVVFRFRAGRKQADLQPRQQHGLARNRTVVQGIPRKSKSDSAEDLTANLTQHTPFAMDEFYC
jgi:hypothetical protein